MRIADAILICTGVELHTTMGLHQARDSEVGQTGCVKWVCRTFSANRQDMTLYIYTCQCLCMLHFQMSTYPMHLILDVCSLGEEKLSTFVVHIVLTF